MELRVFADPAEVALQAASHVAGVISDAEGPFTLGLAGGTTPVAAYELLRGRATGWEKVIAWLSDERWVSPDDERSNGRMAAETLTDHVGARLLRPRWSEFVSPKDSAAFYEAELRSVMENRRPDLILLGMGADGHTASLFPETRALGIRDRWYVSNRVPQLAEKRLTATYPLLWSARHLIVMAVGAAKAEALEASLQGRTPAGRLGDGEASVEWFVDEEAASRVN